MGASKAGPPLAGGYVCVNLEIEANATTSTAKKQIMALPAGMTGQIIAISARARTVTSDPAIEVGNTTTVNAYVTTANLTTAVQMLTLGGGSVVSGRGPVAAGGKIQVTVTNDPGDAVGVTDVAVWMYTEEHASNIPAD